MSHPLYLMYPIMSPVSSQPQQQLVYSGQQQQTQQSMVNPTQPLPHYPHFNLQLQNIQVYAGGHLSEVTSSAPIPVPLAPFNNNQQSYCISSEAPALPPPNIVPGPNSEIPYPDDIYQGPQYYYYYPPSQTYEEYPQASQYFGGHFSCPPVHSFEGHYYEDQMPMGYLLPLFPFRGGQWTVTNNCLTYSVAKKWNKSTKYSKPLSERKNLCGFCKSNRESREVYKAHQLKDEEGKVVCPVLRRFVCPLCRGTGDLAHTISYCPFNQPNYAIPNRIVRNSIGKLYTRKY